MSHPGQGLPAAMSDEKMSKDGHNELATRTPSSHSGSGETDLERNHSPKSSNTHGAHAGEKGLKVESLPEHNAYFVRHDDGTKLVTFGENDPENPRNWSKAKKWYLTILCSYINVLVASQASAYSVGQEEVMKEFGVSNELALGGGLSLYVLGFAIGPMIVAPLSEAFGRRRIYVYCWALFVLLQFGVAFAPNAPVLFVFRFLTGFFSSPPLANTGGVISDLWARDMSGPAMAIYVFGSCSGPPWGNIYAAFIPKGVESAGLAKPDQGWRWIFYLTSLLIMGLHWFLIFFTLKETRHNVILQKKAKRIRKATGDQSYMAVHGDEKKSIVQMFKTALSRPFLFLFTEPITAFVSIWNGLLYSEVFLFNDAFVFVFGPGNGYNWQNSGNVQLTFAAFIVGEFIGLCIYPFTQERYYQKVIRQAGQSVPEARMWSGTVGCCLMPIGLFLFAWTCDRSIPFIVPLIGAGIFGIGFFQVLYGILSWTVDSYMSYSASSLGAAVLVRNLFGAGLPLAGVPMYQNLGRHWATSLVAFLGVPLIPVSWYMFYKGEEVRKRSPWAASHFNDDEDAPH